jgi:hypothetical protein
MTLPKSASATSGMQSALYGCGRGLAVCDEGKGNEIGGWKEGDL